MSQSATDWENASEEDWLIYAISWPRNLLIERIEQRVDVMLDHGLIEEVQGLLERGVSPQAQSMQAIGYKEIAAYLLGKCTLRDSVLLVKQRTRQYAKRQMTWLRRDSRVQWLNMEDFASPDSLVNCLIEKIREAL